MNDKFKILKSEGLAIFGEHIAGDDLAAFKAVYGRARHHVDAGIRRTASNYFDQAVAKKLWFACDCLPEEETRPLLTTNVTGHVARIENDLRMHHASECIFFRSQNEQRAYRHAYRLPDQNEKYLLNGPFTNNPAVDTHERPPNLAPHDFIDRSSRPTSLQRLLWILLVGARINTTKRNTAVRYHYEQVRNISGYARNVVVGVLNGGLGKSISLLDVISFNPRDIDVFRKRLMQSPVGNPEADTPPSRWPRSMRQQGYVVGVVDGVDGDKLRFSNCRNSVQVSGKISVFGEEAGDMLRPPYLAILNLAALNRDSSKTSVLGAYLHPIASRDNWTPVDSEYERRAYLSLVSTLDRLWDAGYEATIEKPLFDLNPDPEEISEVLLPDFRVTVRARSGSDYNRCSLVEVMGYKRGSYQSVKSRVHHMMEKAGIGKVAKYNAFDIPSDAAKAQAWIDEWLESNIYRMIPDSRRTIHYLDDHLLIPT